MFLETITIVKLDKNKGEASIKLVDEDDNTCVLILNKLIIDLTNGADPVTIYKCDGVPFITGSWIIAIKEHILNTWQEYFDSLENGIYIVTDEGINSLT